MVPDVVQIAVGDILLKERFVQPLIEPDYEPFGQVAISFYLDGTPGGLRWIRR